LRRQGGWTLLQDGESVVVNGRAAERGVRPETPDLFEEGPRGAGDEVGPREELAFGGRYVLRDAGELLVVVRAVVEDQAGSRAEIRSSVVRVGG
jgi:hypothetical protein